jgi:hypothetical protein
MTPIEAAQLLTTMAQSLRSEPSQFFVSVNVIGQSVVSHGGTGLSVSVSGGAAGSRTIGQQVSAAGGAITLQPGQATEEVAKQLSALAEELEAIANGLRAATPDRASLWARARALSGRWVPGIVQSVLGNALTLAIGAA